MNMNRYIYTLMADEELNWLSVAILPLPYCWALLPVMRN